MTAPPAPPLKSPPRPIGAPVATPQPKRTLDLTPRVPKAPVPRIIGYAVEGWGKTSMAANADRPFILMARGETGYDTLLGAGQVPAVPAETIDSWLDLMGTLDAVVLRPEAIGTLALDALGGFERLCWEHVCHECFGDDWGEHGFMAYGKGPERAVTEWLKMLAKLDEINKLGVTILLLGHAKVKPFKNPIGADFDRYICDVHEKTWATSSRWADAVLFGNFLTIVDSAKRDQAKNIVERKGKGVGGTQRILYTERRDAYDAKNRYGMEPELWIEPSPASAWSQVMGQIVKQKEN